VGSPPGEGRTTQKRKRERIRVGKRPLSEGRLLQRDSSRKGRGNTEGGERRALYNAWKFFVPKGEGGRKGSSSD